MTRAAYFALIGAALPGMAAATALNLPGTASQTAARAAVLGSYAMPVGPWRAGTIPTLSAEGPVTRRAYRLPGSDRNTLEMLTPLRAQLEQEGYEILFQCKTRDCGGFDFRFQTEILPDPEMHVDLGDFRFLAARKPAADGAAPAEFVSLMVSKSRGAGYIQITRVGASASVDASSDTRALKSTKTRVELDRDTQTAGDSSLSRQLEGGGRLVLGDLDFASGATDLARDNYRTLSTLATYLKAHPDRQVVLVGHTDAQGSLSGNVEISRQRAQAVVDRMLTKYAIPEAQIRAEGIGFLAPRASNLTPDGRTRNRRVEAVLSSIE